jgi:hypothetical protein
MKNMFEATAVQEIKARLVRLKPESHRQWGTMDAPEAVEHCARGMELALGDRKPPRKFMGRVLGPIIKPLALGNDEPMRRNSPTIEELVVADAGDLEMRRERLNTLIDRFLTAGPGGCTSHPHSFFGRLTPDQWAELMYKHLDHHLRQFGV